MNWTRPVSVKLIKKQDEFIEKAIKVLRKHQFCGDCFPDNGWPEVNEAIALYKNLKR